MSPVKVLCVSEFFLPGFKGGGPVRTLRNIPLLLGDAVAFSYLTRDRDLGSRERYEDVQTDRWSDYSYGRVYHASEARFGSAALSRALASTDVDLIYLNCFFGPISSIAIIIRNWVSAYGKPILLAPRGEFSPGALALKPVKKRAFMLLARVLGFYKRVWWHASTQEEKDAILLEFPEAGDRIFTAEDPVEMTASALSSFPKVQGEARLAFISRISPKKNLDGLLTILKEVEFSVTLEIFGPVEDAQYWNDCRRLITQMPANVHVTYRGELKPDEVADAFAQADLFVFPTHGENFGHVIFEALSAGTPVLVSDQTPWKSDGTAAITTITLKRPDDWRSAIATACDLDQQQYQLRRCDALRYARRHLESSSARRDNLRMFQEVVRRSQSSDTK